MAYTNPWDETAPLGTAAASTIDDLFRQLKIDLRERLDDILLAGGKFTDDPILLDVNRTDKVLIIHPSAVVPGPSTGLTYDGLTAITSGVTQVLYCPIPVMDYWTITKVESATDIGGNSSVTSAFNRREILFTKTELGTITTVATNMAHNTCFTGTETIVPLKAYWVTISASGGSGLKFGGLQITYDEV